MQSQNRPRFTEGKHRWRQDFTREHVTTPFVLHMGKLLQHVCVHVWQPCSTTVNFTARLKYNSRCVIIKLTSRVFFSSSPKCCERGSVTGAGRTILPSPENLPTIPDLFSKVWGAEPTWRQHYRLLKENNWEIPSMLTSQKNKQTFLKKNLFLFTC